MASVTGGSNSGQTSSDPARLGAWERSARLWSGLVLFTFVLTHLLNHIVGIFGVAAMEVAQIWRIDVWRSTPGTVLLYGAAIIHVSLALKRIIGRRTWRMPLREALQIALGLAIPILLYKHAIGTRYMAEFAGANDQYAVTLQHLWPNNMGRQFALILVVWGHGIIGLHYSLRTFSWFPRWREPFLLVAVIIPILAIAGFVAAGREAVVLAHSGARWSSAQVDAFDAAAQTAFNGILIVAAGLVLAIGGLALARRVGRRVPIRYVGHGTISLPRGSTLLEASRENGIPHPSLCGGRARCSTCRVLIEEGTDTLPPPGPAEANLLQRISAPSNVRLACQIRPERPIAVRVLLPVGAGNSIPTWSDEEFETGVERNATILVVDIRAFTELTKTQFPYDLVALLNRFISEIRQAIEAHGGRATMYLSDGMLAVFGLRGERGAGSRAALAAARDISRAVDAINAEMRAAISIPLRVGIGIHTGPLILARIGDPSRGYMVTALGESVTIASRLESETKRQLVDCLVSQETLRAAGGRIQTTSRREVNIPGRSEAIVAYGIETQHDPETQAEATA